MSSRPGVSVIVPFAGSGAAASSLLEGIKRFRLGPGDEVIVADNSPEPSVKAPPDGGPLIVARATREHSSYHARNAAAECSSNDWLLFMDADCRPEPDLLDRYFDEPIADDCGIVAGAVVGAPGQRGLLPAWSRSRRLLSEEHLLHPRSPRPHGAAGTGNLLIRRRAFESLGGFHEGIRSGGDIEICWRLQDAGWTMAHRPAARVEHRHCQRLRSLLSQASRHAGGRRWMSRRFTGAFSRPPLARQLARALGGAAFWTLTLRPRRGLFKLIDGVALAAGGWGWHLGRNGVRPVGEVRLPASGDHSVVMITDAFPARSETFVYNEALTLIRQGWQLRVESLSRPVRTERRVARSIRIDYLEDDAPRDKLRDLVWLLRRHPLRCLADALASRRWAREEEVWGLAAIAGAARRLEDGGEWHIHAHFAAGGALVAMRLSRLTGVPFSLTAHAYDIFQHPRNLPEKLREASFAAAECEYAAAHMRLLVNAEQGRRIHRIATGTDGSSFRRRRPHPSGGTVVAIGRLVEKKGFAHLIEAATELHQAGSVSEVVIAGEGPLRDELRALVGEHGLDDFVRLLGPLWGPDAVRELLESADVLCIPSVIAADGDRDALPLVAFEALAMEVPVVASDLAGLPELVRPPWGRLVPPGDTKALAAAVTGLLDEPLERRVEAAREGREFVLTRFDPQREAGRLGELIAPA